MKLISMLRLAAGLGFTAAMASTASAQSSPVTTMYVEGYLGKAYIRNLQNETFNGTINAFTLTNVKGSAEYNDPAYWGLEIGFSNLSDAPVRLGLGVKSLNAKFEKASLNSGVITDTVITYDSTSPPLGRADLNTIGVNADNRVRLYSLNGYYDFKNNTLWQPYLGLGIGFADIRNANDEEFTYSLHAGLNININPRVYLGAHVAWYRIDGPTDGIGIRYNEIEVNNVGLTLGYRF